MPVDAQKSAFDTMFVEYDFIVTIEPCVVDSYIEARTATPVELELHYITISTYTRYLRYFGTRAVMEKRRIKKPRGP